MKAVRLLGVRVHTPRFAEAVDRVATWVVGGGRRTVCLADARSLVEAGRDPDFLMALAGADLVLADGMPLVWLARRRGQGEAERIYGPAFMLALMRALVPRGARHFLYGTTAAGLERLTGRLSEEVPGLRLAGTLAPPFSPPTPVEAAAHRAAIDAAAPDVVWVGLGAPKQERWMAAHRTELAAPVLVGVGAAFDFLAGTKPMAPAWLGRAGLEWAFRLASEPRRLGPRYAGALPRFVWGALGEPPVPPPCIPEGVRVFAVGDVHGRADLLDRLHARLRTRVGPGRNLVVYLGDYVDRGPDSRGVLDRLLGDGAGPGFEPVFLMGNHERMLLDFLDDPDGAGLWLDKGADTVLTSYDVRVPPGTATPARRRVLRDRLAERLPARHAAFLRGLRPAFEIGGYLFVHAGVRPGRRLADQSAKDLLWIKEPFLSSRRWHGRLIIHGHSPAAAPRFRRNAIGLDTGAWSTGVLTALELDGTRQTVLSVGDGVPDP